MALSIRSLNARLAKRNLTADLVTALTGIPLGEIDAALNGTGPIPPALAVFVTLFSSAAEATRQRCLATLGKAPEWRTIPEFERYEASADGHMRRRAAGNGAIPGGLLKQRTGLDGYRRVTIYSADGKQSTIGVHRAVTLAFHGLPPADRPSACHRDGNHINNAATNLYWGSHVENAADRTRHRELRLVQKACSRGFSLENLTPNQQRKINKVRMLERLAR